VIWATGRPTDGRGCLSSGEMINDDPSLLELTAVPSYRLPRLSIMQPATLMIANQQFAGL